MTKVEIYSTEYCPYCQRAKKLLEQKKVKYIEYRVDKDQEKFDEMLHRSDGRRTVPQIFINDQGIGGCDDLYALEATGKLEKLLHGREDNG